MYVLEVENLIRNYQKSAIKKSDEDIKVLKGLNFSVEQGEFVGIMGKSGCGKTTLLKVLGMIDKQTEGTVCFMEKDTSKLYGDELADIRREQIGFVFQDFYLMDSLSVEENIMLPMILGQEKVAVMTQAAQKYAEQFQISHLLKKNPYELDSLSVEENIMLPMILGQEKVAVMTQAAQKYAEQFQISHLLKKNPYELSGGEKQRVAICRALINDPDLILADEPTGNLDSKSGQIVIDALVRINQEFGKTIVMVTHDPQMASYCSRIILLKDGVILDNLNHGDSHEGFYQEIIGRMADL